jgi:hypothetical protein
MVIYPTALLIRGSILLKTMRETTGSMDITGWIFMLTAHHTLPSPIFVLESAIYIVPARN